ncbi:MAG: hypothetical protein M3441_02480 [Chloroflexota bacterium]|nr:hypothetical protein [Chloroflexota bacterium]
MKKLTVIVTALALTWLGLGASGARAQAPGPDAIDPIYALTLTEAINNQDAAAVLDHFVKGGSVTFDTSVFDAANRTLTAAEYADRQRPDQPDVPTDIHLEIVDRSLQIGATTATWTWRETAGFLKDLNVDYIEFSVSATTDDHRFKSITIAPTMESLAKLLSLAPSAESLARLPYSPAVPTLPFAPDDNDAGLGQSVAVVRFEPENGSKVKGAAILSGTGVEGGTSISFHVTGLTPGTPAQATLNAGTRTAPGASAAALPELTVDASGTGTATGKVLFRGTEIIPLADVADGEHIITISQSGNVVAYGDIPILEGLALAPVGMPRTGGAAGDAILLGLALVAVYMILLGVRLTQTRAQS